MPLKYFFLLLCTILLVQCSVPVNNKTSEADISNNAKDSCCANNTSKKSDEIILQSEITCPECGHKKIERLPTDVCVIKYNCEKCNVEMRPKAGDCCVFCTYGTHKCPSKQ